MWIQEVLTKVRDGSRRRDSASAKEQRKSYPVAAAAFPLFFFS